MIPRQVCDPLAFAVFQSRMMTTFFYWTHRVGLGVKYSDEYADLGIDDHAPCVR